MLGVPVWSPPHPAARPCNRGYPCVAPPPLFDREPFAVASFVARPAVRFGLGLGTMVRGMPFLGSMRVIVGRVRGVNAPPTTRRVRRLPFHRPVWCLHGNYPCAAVAVGAAWVAPP